MANYAADNVASTVGSTVTERTATASSDTVPAGALVVWRNTGAGVHIVTLTNSGTSDGLTVANRTISIPAGAVKAGRVNPAWAAGDGTVAVAVDGTFAEVKYLVLGGI